MASNYLTKGLKRSALTVALGLCFAGGVQAQSNVAGAVAGRASSGDTITITNPSTGFSRTITVDATGTYRFSQLPTGRYLVTRNGSAARDVTVNVGVATNVDFSGADATTLDVITVSASSINPIDVSSVESTTIMTAAQIAKVPVARDTTSVALLAPGTVRGDRAFGNLASFGGASVAENQYYLNGFNITNTFNNLNFAQIPFEAIAEQQTKTGGYGAEFGRSTGGVVNQITRRGSNDFHAGANIFWSPSGLVEKSRNLYLNDGTLNAYRENDTEGTNVTSAVWASGALVQNQLFAYALLQYADYGTSKSFSSSRGNSRVDTSRQPKWLVKLDWHINDNNLLEFTGISDTRKYETDYYSTTYDDPALPLNPRLDQFQGTEYNRRGGEIYIARYTGYLTDTFTLSALAGTSTSDRHNYSVTAGGVVNEYLGNVGQGASGCAIITDARPSVVNRLIPARKGCSLANFLGRPDAEDSRDQFRVDAEWMLADHMLRGGVDIDNFQSVAGESYSGGAQWRYGRYASTGITDENSVVRKRVFQSGSTVAVDQTAFFLEDTWSITSNFTTYLGVRWDTFDNQNGDGETFAKIKNQFAPRLGFSWDIAGDSTMKLYGNAGRYALPLTATVAVRGASKSLYSEEYFTYTGVDEVTGAPTGLVRIDNPANGRPIRYLNNEFGVAKNPETIADQDLKPMYQDEYILGFQKQMNDNLSFGTRLIRRDLKAAIDDTCDYRPIIEWALANGFTDDGGIFIEPADKTQDSDIAVYNPGFAFCHLYNPGRDSTFKMDINGDGVLEEVKLTADQLGPDAKRTYSAVELFFEGTWDRAFLQGSYTYARSKGNTEGGVKSDIGQDDTSTTQDFDYPELMEGAYGYLPNDRRHTFKLFGNYEVTDTISVGANLIVQSGRPVNCFGFHPTDSGYGNSYFYCQGELVPRGSAGRLPWTRTLDLNVAWSPAFAEDKLTLKVDVFNVFDSQDVISVNEFGEDAGANWQPNVWKSATGYTSPRSVRFMVQYDF